MSESTERSAYFYRVISLVVDVGTETLRDTFYSKVPKGCVATLFATPAVKSEFDKLKNKKVLTQVQYDKVTCANPDPDTYDISLLTTLLTIKKVSQIPAPTNGWATTPPDPSDVSVGADLLRLRELRNEIVGHRKDAQLDDVEFRKYFCEVETVLVRLASHVGTDEENKTKEMASTIKDRMLEPLEGREKKLLDVFLQWQKEDNEKFQTKLTEVQDSLDNLHIKFDNIQPTTDAVDAARLDDTGTLSSLESQVSGLVQSLSSIARQDDVDQIKENLKHMGDTVQTILATMKMLQQKLDSSNRNIETLSQQATTSGAQPTGATHPKRPKVTNPNALSEKRILDLSKKIGYEWEQLRIHLDFTEAQAHALKKAYDDDVQQRIHVMLKAWHDVVVDCGENPRMLLAAAFVNASTNYAMACELVPKHQIDEYAAAKPATVERIQQINFRKSGYDQGDGYNRPGSGSMPHGAHGSVNVYGGEVNFGGTLTIHSSQSNQSLNSNSIASDGFDGSGRIGMPNAGSFNVYGGKVAMSTGSNVVIGPPAQNFYQQTSYSPVVRGETEVVSDYGPSLSGSSTPSGHPFKKQHDDTLSQSMVAALHKSVGVLISHGDPIGTVFRVGSKYVMTALHVILNIIDPSESGKIDMALSESENVFINFNESPLTPPVIVYKLRRNFIYNVELDVAVLEISNPWNLPKKLNLRNSNAGVTDVSLIGYGRPGQMKKCLDPKCQIVKPNSQPILSAQAWLQQKSGYYRSALHEMGRDPSLVDKGYQGYDHPSKFILDCFMEHGASESGAPLLTNNNERSVEVVGILTHGLPEFYFKLPSFMQPDFPKSYRFEMGAKMEHIFKWIQTSEPDIVADIFN